MEFILQSRASPVRIHVNVSLAKHQNLKKVVSYTSYIIPKSISNFTWFRILLVILDFEEKYTRSPWNVILFDYFGIILVITWIQYGDSSGFDQFQHALWELDELLWPEWVISLYSVPILSVLVKYWDYYCLKQALRVMNLRIIIHGFLKIVNFLRRSLLWYNFSSSNPYISRLQLTPFITGVNYYILVTFS